MRMRRREEDAVTDWPIQEVARLAGTTSRTLRHYGAVGILPPSRVGRDGRRHYDEAALRRLQRILLLRETGLGLDAIGRVLAGTTDETAALRDHLAALRRDRERLDRRIASVERTITTTEGDLMAADILDGFAHEQHREEVIERWGAEAYERSDAWWRGLGDEARADFGVRVRQLNAAWIDAHERGIAADSDEALALARRHVAWLSGIPGTPSAGGPPDWGYVLGLGEMYVADPRFAANYGGEGGARLVRDALAALSRRHRGGRDT